MRERDFWALIKRTTPAHMERIETKIAGVPDIVYIKPDGGQGFLELKRLEKWPVRQFTTSQLGLSPQQALFLHKWRSKGGQAHLLVSVAEEFLLYDGLVCLDLLQHGTTREAGIPTSWRGIHLEWKEIFKVI